MLRGCNAKKRLKCAFWLFVAAFLFSYKVLENDPYFFAHKKARMFLLRNRIREIVSNKMLS